MTLRGGEPVMLTILFVYCFLFVNYITPRFCCNFATYIAWVILLVRKPNITLACDVIPSTFHRKDFSHFALRVGHIE